ncbi:MAG: hydrolase [Oscillospiraceae bacterium]
MTGKEKFLDIYNRCIQREGADKLLEYMETRSDFFTAPASQRYHGAYEGGLVDHSINVYECLADYLSRERAKTTYAMEYEEESVAVVSLLHDICKINCYKPGFRNVKDESGVWQKVPSYDYEDALPYGHGEKSVYILGGFIRLSREEAFAIRYHMGFSGIEDKRNIGNAFEQFPLAFALSVADMEATYFLEGKPGAKGIPM